MALRAERRLAPGAAAAALAGMARLLMTPDIMAMFPGGAGSSGEGGRTESGAGP